MANYVLYYYVQMTQPDMALIIRQQHAYHGYVLMPNNQACCAIERCLFLMLQYLFSFLISFGLGFYSVLATEWQVSGEPLTSDWKTWFRKGSFNLNEKLHSLLNDLYGGCSLSLTFIEAEQIRHAVFPLVIALSSVITVTDFRNRFALLYRVLT